MGTLERAEKARKILLQEYFSSTSRVPELEGFLHLKDGYKKSWKKVYCILRASGLYYSLKGKQKVRWLSVLSLWHCYEYNSTDSKAFGTTCPFWWVRALSWDQFQKNVESSNWFLFCSQSKYESLVGYRLDKVCVYVCACSPVPRPSCQVSKTSKSYAVMKSPQLSPGLLVSVWLSMDYNSETTSTKLSSHSSS